VYSNKICACINAVLQLFARVNLKQDLETQRMRKSRQRFQCRSVEGRCNKQDDVRSYRFRLDDLIFVNREILPENGAKVELARRFQIVIAASNEFLVS